MKKFLGFILGFVFSLGGVVAWLLLEMITGFIASATAYLMVFLFFAGYNLVVRQSKSGGVFFLAALVVLVNIIAINAFYVVLDAAFYEITVTELLADSQYVSETLLYMIIPLAFGGLGLGSFYAKTKRESVAAAKNGSFAPSTESQAIPSAKEEFFNGNKK
jgi:hypothetical protein